MSGPRVLWCDNHVLALAKPAGMPSVPDASGDPSALDWGKAWIKRTYSKPGEVFLGVVHRLDRPVSGVLCLGRTSKGAARLTAALVERTVRKAYLGVVAGDPGAGGELEQHLLKDPRANRVAIVEAGRAGSKVARTRWTRLAARGGRALLRLEPLTGRSHQLRVACASLGTPLLGDLKYGAERALEDRTIALHSHEFEAPHPVQRVPLLLRAAPPSAPWWELAREVLGLGSGAGSDPARAERSRGPGGQVRTAEAHSQAPLDAGAAPFAQRLWPGDHASCTEARG